MSHTTYLGRRGYTIYKETLSIHQQEFIRNELTVKPFISSSPIQMNSYPIYKESSKKFYIPRYFGTMEFGEPDESKIGDGVKISLKFIGELREYQNNIISKYMESIKNGGFGGLLDLYTGSGKTVMALKLIQIISLKTIIIVHKGFLLNQWIERIEQFLPEAKIGKIQGQIVDIEDKDIVIAMLQSISMKDYPEDLFESFGFTIIDECHHMSAEVFSKALEKIVTKYNLGLSATMNRKDGLTKVFKLFLGDVIHKEKNPNNSSILIKAVNFSSNDEEFNTIEYDFRGNVKYSTMMTKLCNFNRRTELIVDILVNELKNNSEQQIMVLAQYKTPLTYLYNAINHKNIATVGYYIGGMKDTDLKLSEGKQIILGTYGMASEGLDIKTLTTLIMATPLSDVEQSVGRIMRKKHENPLVIDIIDQHQVFKKQWYKRKKFYLSKNYQVKITDDYNKNLWNDISKKHKDKDKDKDKDKHKLHNVEEELQDLLLNNCMVPLHYIS